MRCLRIDLHRLLPLYLDGAASPRIARRIESHLLDCNGCRGRVLRLREARSFLGELAPVSAPPFAGAAARARAASPRGRSVLSLIRHFAADALVATTLFAIFALFYTHAASAHLRPFDATSFRAVTVKEIAATNDPHVIVSGVVAASEGDDDAEGSRRFRLSDPNDPKAFVVCEILDGDSLKAPKNGQRVRVWGVSRYDSNPNHRWFEIHPVLKMEVSR